MTGAVEAGLREHFQEALAKKNLATNDVAAGRKYVRAYVAFVHYVERLYEAARQSAVGHYEEAEAKH